MLTEHARATEESGHLRVDVFSDGKPLGMPLFLRPGQEMSVRVDRGFTLKTSPATEAEFLDAEALLEGAMP